MTRTESEKFEAVRLILLREWDPLFATKRGQYDERSANEYDGYAREIAAMMARGASFEDVFAYLKWAETENMQLSFSQAKAQRPAELIVQE